MKRGSVFGSPEVPDRLRSKYQDKIDGITRKGNKSNQRTFNQAKQGT